MHFVHAEETAGRLFCRGEVRLHPQHLIATLLLPSFDCSDCGCAHRVQMSELSSFQTTSFHTSLSFLDEETDDALLEEEGDDDEYDDEYSANIHSGSQRRKKKH